MDAKQKKPSFTVFGLSKSGGNKPRELVEIKFIASSLVEAEDWVVRIREKAQESWALPSGPRKPVFIIVNPFSGQKKAIQLFNKVIAPLLNCSGVEFEMIGKVVE